ncbi:Nn.00g008900.m01.CDS01 [Neocucurbitaria sp. VM-36]
MSFKTFATLALATGLAVAKPINAPEALPGYTKRNNKGLGQGFNGAVVNGFSGNGFNFIDGFNNFNQQQQVIQIQEQNLQIVDNGFQQQVVQQVQEVLVVDQVNNGFNNDLNNLFRKSNFQNQFQEVSTVMLVVQEIQIAVDDGRGNAFQQNVFAQSAVVANRGAFQTQTVMVFDSRTLIAQDVLGNNALQNIGQFGGIAGATGVLNNALPTKTAGVQLFGAKPTWSSVAQDPAATLGGIWQGALEDLQKGDFDQQDMQLNEQIAAEEKKALDEAQKQAEQDQQKVEDEAAAQNATEKA